MSVGSAQITSEELHKIGIAPSADRLQNDIQTLVDFGTRHTLSDTVSQTRGIGAAKRWIKAEFERISEECGGCLEVFYVFVPADVTEHTLENVVIDNYYFGVASVSKEGFESPVVFPRPAGSFDGSVINEE